MAERAQAVRLKGSSRLGSYLKRLRTGYGYSLRRVEERARAEGGEIDNSQLSRYEKGVCYPSFDKLRVLANVFNVSIQSFSDVVDLEAFEDLKPESGDPREMHRLGLDALSHGDTGLAFALLERSVELLAESTNPDDAELLVQARVNQSGALTRLGKLSLAEQELRSVLREHRPLSPRLEARALLSIANVHAEQGDLVLAELESDRARELAERASDERTAARAMHTLGFVLGQLSRHADAIELYQRAGATYEALGIEEEALRVRINVGACYVALRKHREGIRMLRESLDRCRTIGHRRLEARAWSNLAEAYHRSDDGDRAARCIAESNLAIGSERNEHADILFLNAFLEWEMARGSENPTREKIAFGRLKALRSHVEKRFPEVDAFDAFVEQGGRHA